MACLTLTKVESDGFQVVYPGREATVYSRTSRDRLTFEPVQSVGDRVIYTARRASRPAPAVIAVSPEQTNADIDMA